MPRVLAIAMFQAAGPEVGTSLTLGTGGVLALAVLLALAGAGWFLWALSRGRTVREAPAERREPPPAPAPIAAPPPPDPLEEAYRSAESGLAGAAVQCRDGAITRAGEEAAALMGVGRERLIGLPVTSLAAAEDLLPLSEAIRRTGEEGTGGAEVSFRLAPPWGGGRVVSARLARPRGAPAGSFVMTLTDISGPAAFARSAAEIASRVHGAFRTLTDGILVTGHARGREIVVLANPALGEIFSIPPASLEGRPIEDLRERLEASLPAESVRALLSTSEGTELIEVPTDPPRLIERSVRAMEGPGRHGRLLTYRDVTRDREREETLRRSARDAQGARENLEIWHEQLRLANEGLERRLTDFTRLNRELKLLDEMKSNLLANVSHELQTPLVSIKGYTEMILKGRMGPLTEEQERGLKVALRNIDRLIGLIDGLLTFARAERESGRLRLESFKLRPLVEEVVDLLKEKAAEMKISFTVSFPAGDLAIRGDRDRIAQVFINLLSNAIKYNIEGGSVVVEATRGSRGMARVEVRDTGRGIPRQDLDHVFDRFYRSGEAEGEGTGLGLSITKDILRMHGCMIRADSEPGKGSTFSFTLPLDPRAKGEKVPKGPTPPSEA